MNATFSFNIFTHLNLGVLSVLGGLLFRFLKFFDFGQVLEVGQSEDVEARFEDWQPAEEKGDLIAAQDAVERARDGLVRTSSRLLARPICRVSTWQAPPWRTSRR